MQFYRTAVTKPHEDDLCVVALYDANNRRQAYALCYWRDGEWQSDEGDYSWSGVMASPGRPVGALWAFVLAAPEHLDDIPGHRLAKLLGKVA